MSATGLIATLKAFWRCGGTYFAAFSALISAHLFILPQITAASAGERDVTFNGSGLVLTSVVPNCCGTSVALQQDGKVVVAGYGVGLTRGFALARYDSDGSLDTGFNGTGKVYTWFLDLATPVDAEAWSVAVQADGRILAAGYASNGSNYDFALARYNADGSLDTTFNGTGRATTPIGGGNDYGLGIGVRGDGKILVAGHAWNGSDYDFAVARYNTNGSLDSSFNGTGKVTTPVGSTNDYSRCLLLQADGKFIVGGASSNGSNYDFALVRFNADGSRDTGFGAGGKVTTSFGNGDDHGWDLALQGDGKILVAGHAWNGSDYDFAVARYNTNGSLDSSFNGTGKVTTRFGESNDYCRCVVVQDDGKIVLAGRAWNGSDEELALARYNADGSLDTSFNGTGKVSTVYYRPGHHFGYGMVLQPDGKIVVAGGAGTSTTFLRFLLVRYVSGDPEISVEQPTGSGLINGITTVDFGQCVVGLECSREFTIRNTGFGSTLRGLGVTFEGEDEAGFEVVAAPASAVSGPNGSTTFTVRFAPTSTGAKTAVMHIASNDSDENPFDVTLGGSGRTALEVWRLLHFETLENSGPAADMADPDGDGLRNLTEFGFGLDPRRVDLGCLPEVSVVGEHLMVTFEQPAHVMGLVYGAEVSTDLSVWEPVGDSGDGSTHIFSVPMDLKDKLFLRLNVRAQ